MRAQPLASTSHPRRGDVALWRVVPAQDDPVDPWTRRSGRWHHGCKPVIYAATSPELAMLEALAHLDAPRRIHALARLVLRDGWTVRARGLPSGWPCHQSVTRDAGDAWLAQGRADVLLVPSALCTAAMNALVATARLGPGRLQAHIVHRFRFDPRLVRDRGSGRAARD
jgi:RES domain-containing protein